MCPTGPIIFLLALGTSRVPWKLCWSCASRRGFPCIWSLLRLRKGNCFWNGSLGGFWLSPIEIVMTISIAGKSWQVCVAKRCRRNGIILPVSRMIQIGAMSLLPRRIWQKPGLWPTIGFVPGRKNGMRIWKMNFPCWRMPLPITMP